MTAPEIGDEVVLDVDQRNTLGEAESLLITGIILAKRPHYDNPTRVLYYFACQRVGMQRGDSIDTSSLETISTYRRNDLRRGFATLVSSENYVYRLDGWYDEHMLFPTLKKDRPDSAELASLIERSRKDMDSYCELCYFFFATRPWFEVDFTVLGAVSAPDSAWAYSAYTCHKCLHPFLVKASLEEHLNAYCEQKAPPGIVIYSNRLPLSETRFAEVRVRCVDGAKNIHYCRRLALLSKGFIESKVLINDVDIFEFFTLTISRSAIAPLSGFDDRIPPEVCDVFDADKWNGELVVGYFCRIKHQPDHCLSCIAVFPPFQGRGLGNLLISVAYATTFIRQSECGCLARCGRSGGKVSTPWSFMGQRALFSYWRRELNRTIAKFDGQEISSISVLAKSFPGVHADDLATFLVAQRHAFCTPISLSDEEYARSIRDGTLRRDNGLYTAQVFQGANTAPGPNPKAQLGLLLFDGDGGDDTVDDNSTDVFRKLMRFDMSHFTRRDAGLEYNHSLYHY